MCAGVKKTPQPHTVTETLSRLFHPKLAAKGAARRGGYFDPENVPYALEAMPVIEAALQHYCDMLRADRGALRDEGKNHATR